VIITSTPGDLKKIAAGDLKKIYILQLEEQMLAFQSVTELSSISTRIRFLACQQERINMMLNLLVLFWHEMGDKFVALVGSGRQVYVVFY
jgi:hypothetical protein